MSVHMASPSLMHWPASLTIGERALRVNRENAPRADAMSICISNQELDLLIRCLMSVRTCWAVTGMVAAFVLSVGCAPKPATKSTSEKPAKVEAHPSEMDIYRVVLTESAEQRLQIRTVKATMQAMPRTRLLGGQLLVPDGARVVVTAPLTGSLASLEATSVPSAGQRVAVNQTLFVLRPILRPEQEVPGAAERVQMANARASLVTAQIQADGDFQQAMAQLEGAEIALNRAQKLLDDRAGSQRAVDDALAAFNIATSALEAAKQRKVLLDDLSLEAETSKVPEVPILAPSEGVVQTISAQVGQVISAGAPLLEIVDLKSLWVRVPIYAGQVHEMDLESPAIMRELSESADQISVQPITAPPTADPLAASIDLYYRLDNSSGQFHPGERVTVHVPMKGESESLVVPNGAILRDIHGVAWVYVRSDEREYRRERVNVRFSTEDLTVLADGPPVGTDVVTDGAAELFGTEFGAGK